MIHIQNIWRTTAAQYQVNNKSKKGQTSKSMLPKTIK